MDLTATKYAKDTQFLEHKCSLSNRIMMFWQLARQQIRRLGAVRQVRFYCEGSTPAGEDEILGIYTPVTKRLWVERQQRAKLNDGTNSDVREPVPVPPRPITITYPFSTSHTLREQVGLLHKYCQHLARTVE